MVQWLDLPVGLKNKIYQYINDDNWNTDYTHFEVATVRHICSTLHQIVVSIRTEITSVLKIQIFHYFMSVKEHIEFPHYGGKEVIFLLQRSQSYDCIKKFRENQK